MKEVTIQVFKFHELEKNIQEKVINHFRYDDDYVFIDDDIKIIKEFAEDFGVNVYDYSLSPYSHSYIKYDFDNFDEDNINLSEMLNDEPLYEILFDEFKKQYGYTHDYKYSFEQVMERAKKYILDEMEYQDSDNYIIETIEMNDYDFTKDGNIH